VFFYLAFFQIDDVKIKIIFSLMVETFIQSERTELTSIFEGSESNGRESYVNRALDGSTYPG
jgi:hypothetical protein